MTEEPPPLPPPPPGVRGTSAAGEAGPRPSAGPQRNGLGTAALVLGVLQFLCLPIVGTILAIVFGKIGMNRARRGEASNGGVASAGFALGIIGLVLAVVGGIAGAIIGANAGMTSLSDPSAGPDECQVSPGAQLTAVSLSNCNLAGADLPGIALTAASVSGVNLNRANLDQVRMTNTSISMSNLSRARLRNCVLTNVSIASSDLRGADFTGCTLTNLALAGSNYDSTTTWPAGFTPY